MQLSPSLLRDALATACVFAASNALLLLVSTLHARLDYRPETTRKLLHIGMGLVALSYPFVFTSPLPVLLINGAFVLLLLLGAIHEPLRHRWHHLTSPVNRKTAGEFYFPVAITLL